MNLDEKIAIKEGLMAEIGKEEAEKIWLRAKEILREIEERYPDISKGEQMHVGFRNVFYPKKKGEYRMDIVECPYNRYFTELGTPELTQIFCINDECTYGDIPGLEFIRKTTLGTGGDKCDFYIRVSQ